MYDELELSEDQILELTESFNLFDRGMEKKEKTLKYTYNMLHEIQRL